MANMVEATFLPIFAMLIFGFAIIGIILTPQAEEGFKKNTNQELAKTQVQVTISAFFRERNNKDLSMYKAISYRLCRGSHPQNEYHSSSLISGAATEIPRTIDYLELKFNEIPSDCESESSFTNIDVDGTDSARDRDYEYEKVIPVRGNETVRMKAVYEIE
jgi:hypothetical protein